jgi:hypothetical protein
MLVVYLNGGSLTKFHLIAQSTLPFAKTGWLLLAMFSIFFLILANLAIAYSSSHLSKNAYFDKRRRKYYFEIRRSSLMNYRCTTPAYAP